MGRYLKALWYFCTGRFAAAANALQSNKYVMEATYDASIGRGADRLNTVRNAVAQLMTIEATRMTEIKQKFSESEKLTKIKQGAKVAMQKRIDALLAQGKTKEEVQQDPEFIRHSGNYKDASSSLDACLGAIKDKESDLHERQAQIATYKLELQQMQKGLQALKTEKVEAVADVAIAQQMQAINDVLTGVAEDTTDRDLIAVREAAKQAKSKAKVTAELAGNDARLAENEYLNLATGSEADKELDGLLNWGESDASTEKLEDAKLPD